MKGNKMFRPNLVNVSMLGQRGAQTNFPNAVVNVRNPMIPQPQIPVPSVPLQSIILDSSSAIKLSLGTSMYQERCLMARNDIWHKIIILRGAQYDKEMVLKSILRAVTPADFIPVKYQVVGQDACFMARNCDKALDQLCKRNLIIPCLDGNSIILSITLGFASIHDLKINIQPILLTALKKRFNAEKKILNLDNFHRDPDVYSTVYCPLSQCKTMAHVLKLAKTALGVYESLHLQNNELNQLSMLETTNIKSVKYVDLRNNNLLKVENLEPLKTLSITDLWLDGNPLCENYSNPSQYVEAVRQFCPSIKKLDGIPVSAPGLPLIFKSYVKNWKKRKLVEQFVEHFFTAYDFKDRNVLRGLYHKDSWYSMTVGTPTSPTSKKSLEPFGHENRNLLIFGKNSLQLLHYGEDEILKIMKKLPQSQHIHKSFCCDLMYDSEEMITISVEGLFKLINNPTLIYSFNRTFVLSAEDECEFKIRNDQYHVYLPINKTDLMQDDTDEKQPVFVPTCYSPWEQESMAITLQESTTMKIDSCKKYLEEARWNMKEAIKNFLCDYKNNYVPSECFE